MVRDYYFMTIIRNGKYENIVDAFTHPFIFLILEKEFGRNDTVIINYRVISKEEYEYFTKIKTK